MAAAARQRLEEGQRGDERKKGDTVIEGERRQRGGGWRPAMRRRGMSSWCIPPQRKRGEP